MRVPRGSATYLKGAFTMSQELTRKDFIRLSFAFVAVAAGVGACSDDKTGSSSGTSGGSSSGDLDSGTSSGDIDSGNSSGNIDSGTSSGNIDSGTSGGNDSGTSGDSGGASCNNSLTLGDAQIAGNHSHAATIPSADLMGSADKTYSIQGASGHTHSITLTAANFASLRAGNSVSVTSTSSGHTHVCTIKCA